MARARAIAAGRFHEAFDQQHDVAPNDRWRVHLEIQASALLETAEGVRLRDGRIRYRITDDRTITPYVVEGEPVFSHFVIRRTAAALFEYWLIISEILASSAWAVTKVVTVPGEYDDALRRMRQPQLVRAITGILLPSAEWRDDGTALLEVTVYTRASEERIERRTLALDAKNEFHFHSRQLLAEAQGGVPV
ncbi:MAG TPA: hypothetical protein VJ901_23135 [Thermoanaerobaculia bacterium]|nr:hypothetical protein [Thermoanaerobaculia bacterium]